MKADLADALVALSSQLADVEQRLAAIEHWRTGEGADATIEQRIGQIEQRLATMARQIDRLSKYVNLPLDWATAIAARRRQAG